MAFYLQSPAGTIATFQEISQDEICLAIGNDIVELSFPDARKVWRALILCQYQRIDHDALMLYQAS